MQIFHLNDRGIIGIRGNGAESFLGPLLSGDIKKAQDKALLYTLLLTPQGKILYDFFILKIPGGYLLDVPAYYIPEIIRKLEIYKLRAKIEIEEQKNIRVYASFAQGFGFPDPRHINLGERLITDTALPQALSDVTSYHLNRIKYGVPDFNTDLEPEKYFPIELGLDKLNAIDYKKGCYVGQEVTARTHYRGIKRKSIYNIIVKSTTQESLKGQNIEQNSQKIGECLGVCAQNGLALIRDDMLDFELSHAIGSANIEIMSLA